MKFSNALTHARGLLAVGGLVLIASCSPIVRNHGYIPVAEDLSLIAVGQDTRETVTQKVGPPTTGGIVGADDFYYVRSQFRTVGAAAPVEISREVLAISFGTGGTVRNIEMFGLEDGRVVTLSRRVTDDNIRDTTFLRQLMGNVGRVNAADFIGEQ